MKISDIANIKMNNGLAYILGLIYTRYTQKNILGKEYIVGNVNHNANKITSEEIAAHYKDVNNFLKENIDEQLIDLRTNKCSDYTISPKKGFSILIDMEENTQEHCETIINDRINEILGASEEMKAYFIRGCFDGRASFDTNFHLIALDVENNSEKIDMVIKIAKSIGIDIQENSRNTNTQGKMLQLRVKTASLNKYMTKVGFFSIRRRNDVESYLN